MSQIDRTAEAPMPEGREKVAALVFGKKLRRDGTLDQRGLAVVSKAEELYRRAGREKLTLVLSGGKSSSYVLRGVNVPSEASAMKKELVARGVAEESMLLEEGSYDTIGNVILAYPLIKSLGAKKLVLVGERPMISRAEKIVRKVMGGAYEIRTEPADVELGRAYT
ncbi:MAG: YdcF family protein, partial [Candidatus Marsarchaeota archaeon]|nr:YdcF family protein [Candidatus Marsarchaeota archaeon]